jgi:antitoxin component YwqK of YwqJK toxin-antitoxin module
MKRIVMLLLVLCVSVSYAQKERKLKLNNKTNLIEVTYFHENGEISQTGFYTKDGKLHGDWFSYCQEGNKLTSAQYDKGLKVGKWFYWRGDQLKEVDYENGKIKSVSEWKNVNSTVASND